MLPPEPISFKLPFICWSAVGSAAAFAATWGRPLLAGAGNLTCVDITGTGVRPYCGI